MTRAEQEARLRRADAALKVEGPRWPEVRARARRALRLRQAGVAVVAVAVFVAVIAGALLARAAMDDDAGPSPARNVPTYTEPLPTVPPPTTATEEEQIPPTVPTTTTTTTEPPAPKPNLSGEVRRRLLVVTNSGDAPAGPFRVTAGQAELMASPGLDPGETARADRRPVCPPGTPAADTPTVDAEIDPENAVDESDEDNSVPVPCEVAPG